MKPFYFGSSQKPLFGVHHQPEPGLYRDFGVVLCHPMGDEYVQAHRAFRQLAIRLAGEGFHVLRFDYYGCGDSSGDGEEGCISEWRNDIATAINELKDISGLRKVSLVGARLGATLAALVGFFRKDVKNIVLWEPIVNGKNYIKELVTTHQDWLFRNEWVEDILTAEKQHNENNEYLEIMGFPIPATLRRELENIDLMNTQQCLVKQIYIVEGKETSDALAIAKRLMTLGIPVNHKITPEPRFWRQQAEGKILVPIQTVQSIVSWISEGAL